MLRGGRLTGQALAMAASSRTLVLRSLLIEVLTLGVS